MFWKTPLLIFIIPFFFFLIKKKMFILFFLRSQVPRTLKGKFSYSTSKYALNGRGILLANNNNNCTTLLLSQGLSLNKNMWVAATYVEQLTPYS